MTSFSLSLDSLTWVNTLPRGQRSSEVDRAILFYINSRTVIDSRDKLQELALEYSRTIDSLESQVSSLKRQLKHQTEVFE